jgi:hypothetical protein
MFWRRTVLFVFLLTGHIAAAQSVTLTVAVIDENSVAIRGVRVTLQLPNGQTLRCETGFAGRCQFFNLPAGVGELRAEKEGFYVMTLTAVQIGVTANVDIALTQVHEIKEVVNVVESPPAIDPAKTQAQEQLTGMDIVNIPYQNTNDYRNVLNFIPGVQQDSAEQPHLAGAQTYQTLTLFDGFNVTQPSNGLLLIRVATDALRSINTQTSRYTAEYGKGSGGILELNTGTGDDHIRFLATDFIPSFQNKKGFTFNEFNPRFILSGPIRKGALWFYDAVDIDYVNTVVPELPANADSDLSARFGNFIKLQANLTPRDTLTGSFNYNHFHDPYLGISPANPQGSTPDVSEPMYQASVKEQHYFAGGELLEAGFGFNRYDLEERPHGSEQYFLTPETSGGSYYLSANTRATRWQLLSNLYLRPRHWHGQHDLKFGIDYDRLSYDASFLRQPIVYLREGQTVPPVDGCVVAPSDCTRYSTFPGTPSAGTYNAEVSGYVQDRWLPNRRFLIEAGVRYDWDQIVRHSLVSPRLAVTYVLDSAGKTKLSAGIGLFYDATPIFLIARPQGGTREDTFFSTGDLVPSHIISTFSADTHRLQASRFVNWSLALERKLPAEIYIKAEYIQKRGTHGFVYDLANPAIPDGNFVLQSTRQDHYDALQIGARRAFHNGHMVFASYTRSHSRSNQVLDFNVDNPQFSPQQSGPYPWDAPNRFLSWGLLPLYKGYDLAYSSELRSGFPFSVVDDQLKLVGAPGSRRFSTWFTLNTHIEKRFHALGYYWAIRGGFNNVTGRRNYTYVNNNIDSPGFLAFGNYEGRTLTGRIRFLGRK